MKTRHLRLAAPLALFIAACEPEPAGTVEPEVAPTPTTAPAPPPTEPAAAAPAAPEVTKAVAVLHPTEGNQTAGSVTFTKEGDGVQVSGKVTGLERGKHGFHVHEWGNCDCPDGSCAGDHYAPEGNPHGAPSDEKRHTGDLGNIEAGEDGTATIDMTDPVIALGGPHSIIGRAVIVHAGEDDLKSQPSGEAGDRLACGVVGVAGE